MFFEFSYLSLSTNNKHKKKEIKMSVRSRIIDESVKMFALEGVKAIRMDDIATRLGISKRTIYQLFEDKNTLVELSLDRHFELEREAFEANGINAQNIVEEFMVLIDNASNTLKRDFVLMEGVKRFYPVIYAKVVTERNQNMYEHLQKSIKEGIESGIFIEQVNIELAILFFMDSFLGVLVRTDVYLPKDITLEDAFKYNVLYFFRGISTPLGVKIVDSYLNDKTIK